MKRLLPFLLLLCCVTSSFALTGSDILARARLMLRDTSSDSTRQRYSDTQLLNWLNDGQREANAQDFIVMSSFTFSLTSGTTEYALPSDFVATWRVTINNLKLDQTSWNEQDSNSTGWQKINPGTPINYYIYMASNPTIGMIPCPSSTYVAQSTPVVKMWYFQQTNDLTSTAQVPFNGWIQAYPYHSMLAYYIAYRGLWTVGDTEEATGYLSEWQLWLNGIKSGINRMPDFNPGFAGRRN